MYGKLAGMTGTADTEAYEFPGDLRPRNGRHPAQPAGRFRKDELDLSTRPTKEKYNAVIADIRDCHERGQPVLVGTTRSRTRTHLPRAADQGRCRTRCSTPSSTRRKPRSSPRPVARRDHHRHQHGRPGHRHRARRQCREEIQFGRGGCQPVRRAEGRPDPAAKAEWQGLHEKVRPPAACASSPPSATRPPHRQPAAWPLQAARATRLQPLLPERWTTR